TYNGEAKEAFLELVPEGFLTGLEETTIVYTGELTEGKPVNAGDYTAFFTLVDGENEYQAKVSFTIVPLSLEGAAVTLAETEYNYDGRVKEAEITSVLVGSSTLTAENYTISYLKNGKAVTAPKEAGIYTVRIQGKGNYTGKLETELIILPAQPKMMIRANPQTQSPGKNVAVSVTIANPWNPQLQDTPKSTLTYQIGSQKPQQFTDSFVIPKDTAANTTILITATTAATANYTAGEAELKLVVGACKHSDGTELRGEKEATATEAGYTGDTYCKSCGVKLSTGKDIPAKGTADKAKFPFTDVPQIAGNWKYESVYHVWEGGIMNGISGTTLFRPDHPLTRAMFATVLYRMAGSPAVTYSDRFTDVVDGEWYSKAIIWANEKKIVDGYTNGSYGINDNITREQIAKMLYLYGSLQGYKVDGKAALDSFTDASDVSGWAVNFMRWAVDAQMITGKPNGDGSFRLDPKGEATRAECAKMLMMFRQKYVK
ncbi:MAG: S-layer homology domain-containing protein, partial [Lachnospiraceae bacterium]|nr:S-layer homology domain-containing protein [Lachnospiraceae bacterium]